MPAPTPAAMPGLDAELIFDLLLCLFLLGLALRILTTPQLYQGAILFIAFGLGMALAWTRLAAPDVALAEAAIGAGLVGVLLLDSLRVFAPAATAGLREPAPARPPSPTRHRQLTAIVLLAAAATVAIPITLAIWHLPAGGGLTAAVAEAMPESGVDHPVTAVLLNFRGYDTWLEIGVLLLAMLGLLAIHGDRPSTAGSGGQAAAVRPDALLDWLTRLLVPVLVLAAGYLLWLGKFAPGGAFQSGVVLAAAAILLRLNGFALIERLPSLAWRAALLLGFAAFLVHGIGSLLAGRALLQYPPGHAGSWILALEALAAFSIAFTLAAFFIALNRADRSDPVVH